MEIITLTKEHPYYPDELKETNLTLRAIGNLEILKLKSKRIAVVGSRDATYDGIYYAKRITRALELGKDVYVVNPNFFRIKPAGNVKLIELGAKTLNF